MGYYDMAVNKSGVKLAIFEGWPSVDKGKQIGTIYDREAFIWAGTEDGNEISFRYGGCLRYRHDGRQPP